MAFEAKHRFARIAPRKARLVMDLVRGRDVDDAITHAAVRQAARQRHDREGHPLRRRQRQRAGRRPAQHAVRRQGLGGPGPGHQAVPAEGPRQGVPDQEAHESPGRRDR